MAGEVFLLLAYAVVEASRLVLGSKGNKTQKKRLVVLFLVRPAVKK